MEAKEMLKRAKIQIQGKNSFFAYLSLYLKMKESKDLPDYAGAGVDMKGNFYYKRDFIEGLSNAEVEGLIVHEILHLSLLHLSREGGRDHKIFNISTDIVVNQLLKDNGFSLPSGGIISDGYNKVNIGGVVIEDCNKKTAEQVYSELEKQAKKVSKALGQDGSGDGLRFDEHIKGDGEAKGKNKGKALSPSEMKELEKTWGDRTQEALTVSQIKGDIPVGMERLVGELHKEKINWRSLLNQYITQQIPYDHSYCIDKETIIKSPSGDVKIKDLKVGQIIYGFKDGAIVENRIKKTFKKKIKEKFIIYTSSGKKLICSGEHKILSDERFIKAKNLNVGDVVTAT